MLLPPYSRNLASRLVKSPKVHWLDAGIWRSLTHYSGPVTGQMYESWVVSEVFKLIRTRGLKADLTHYRTVSGMEVDLLIEYNSRVFGIEVKSSTKSFAVDASPMRRLAQALGDAWGGGLVVNRGRAIEPLGDTIWSIPACRLLT